MFQIRHNICNHGVKKCNAQKKWIQNVCKHETQGAYLNSLQDFNALKYFFQANACISNSSYFEMNHCSNRKYSTEQDWKDLFEKKKSESQSHTKSFQQVNTYKEGIPKKRIDQPFKDNSKFRVPDILGQFKKNRQKTQSNFQEESHSDSSILNKKDHSHFSERYPRNKHSTSQLQRNSKPEDPNQNQNTQPTKLTRAQLAKERISKSKNSNTHSFEESFRKEEPNLLSNKSSIMTNKERIQYIFIKERIKHIKFNHSIIDSNLNQQNIIDRAALYIFRGSIKKLRNLFPDRLSNEHILFLLQCAINGKKYLVGEKIFNKFKSLHKNPEAIVSMAVNIWGKEGRVQEIEKWISYIDEHSKDQNHKLLIRNALLNALVRNGQITEAKNKFDSLFSLGSNDSSKPFPSSVSFSTLMKGCVTIGDTIALEELYNLSYSLNIISEKDVYDCNLFLEAAVAKNDEELLWKYFKKFFKSSFIQGTNSNNFSPNIVTLNHILKFYSQRGDSKSMEKYLDLFQKDDPKRRLNSRSIFIMLQCYYQTQMFVKAEELFKIYYNYGIRKHIGIFETTKEVCHIMLEIFDRTDKLEDMQSLFDRMYLGRTAASIDESTIFICIEAYRRRSSYLASAAENLKKMERILEKYKKFQENKENSLINENEINESETKETETKEISDENLENEELLEDDIETWRNDVDIDIEEEFNDSIRDDNDKKESIKYLW